MKKLLNLKTSQKLKTPKLLLCCLVFFSSSVMAKLTIEISQGVDKPTRIAVVPFKSSANINKNIDEIMQVIQSDLKLSGRFELIPAADMLSTPTVGDEIFYADWRLSKVEFLLVGKVTQTKKTSEVEYALYDVVNAFKLFSKKVKAVKSRGIAHRISNDVYFNITGIQGIFDSRIVYVSEYTDENDKRVYQLKLSDQDGARESIITQSFEPLLSPTFSPDATKVAYVSFESGNSAIYEQDLYTGKRKIISNYKGVNSAPSYSPDGTKLAMVLSKDGNSEIYIKDFKSSKVIRFTNHYAIDTEPNWMPNGQSIIFTSDRGGTPQIYKKRLRGGKLTRITREGTYNARPRISQDGKFLVLVNGNDNLFKIAVLNVETKELLSVTSTKNDESPSISPNGAMIIYSTNSGKHKGLNVVSLDAGVRYKLPSDQVVREPAWSPIVQK